MVGFPWQGREWGGLTIFNYPILLITLYPEIVVAFRLRLGGWNQASIELTDSIEFRDAVELTD